MSSKNYPITVTIDDQGGENTYQYTFDSKGNVAIYDIALSIAKQLGTDKPQGVFVPRKKEFAYTLTNIPHNKNSDEAVMRGIYTSLEELQNMLEREQDAYCVHEGWYEYCVIEKFTFNQLDPWDDFEIWYKWECTDVEEGLGRYVKIDKPEELKGIVGYNR
jgi:hypothetical protein